MKQFNIERLLAFVLTLFILVACGPTEAEIQRQKELEQEAYEKKKSEERIEKARKDSIEVYIHRAELKNEERKYINAVSYIDSALTYAKNRIETSNLLQLRANYLYNKKEYKKAVTDYTYVIEDGLHIADNYYNRAKCYRKLKMYKEAVADLRYAISLGHQEAEVLHDKINPERKRIAYYITLCCDGTTSNANGRGACSHHGGVCDWNHPIYETYRKY